MQFDEQLKDGVCSPELVAQSAQLAQNPDPPAIVHSQLAAGDFIGGGYEIVSSLGSGGMSSVYKCKDVALHRLVAVKLMHPHSTTNAQSLLRFQQEGKAIALMKHPNIVEVMALQSTQEGEPYLVMEIVAGITLSNLIETEGALPISRASKLVSQICAALEHAHSHGVVHRDLKPSNIMIVDPGSSDESVKLLDFGIAKILAPTASIKATQTGEVFGSPGYMSPEQVHGKPVSEKSDQYSLGCVIFEMLTGKMPFVSDSSFAVMMSHVQNEAPSLAKTANREFPAHVERTVAKMMAKDPSSRFATISDAAKGFAGQSKVEKANKRFTLKSAASVGLCALVIFGLLGIFLAHGFGGEPSASQVMANTGYQQLALGNNGAARDCFRTALKQANVSHASDIVKESIMSGLGATYERDHQYSQAKPCLTQALALSRQTKNDLEQAVLLERLSICDRKTKNTTSAVSEATEALTIMRRLFGSDSQKTANALFHVADSEAKNQQYEESEKACNELFEIDLKLHPDKRTEQIAETYALDADILDHLGRSKAAIDAAKMALNVWQSLEGKDGDHAQHVAQWLIKHNSGGKAPNSRASPASVPL